VKTEISAPEKIKFQSRSLGINSEFQPNWGKNNSENKFKNKYIYSLKSIDL